VTFERNGSISGPMFKFEDSDMFKFEDNSELHIKHAEFMRLIGFRRDVTPYGDFHIDISPTDEVMSLFSVRFEVVSHTSYELAYNNDEYMYVAAIRKFDPTGLTPPKLDRIEALPMSKPILSYADKALLDALVDRALTKNGDI
jgi:hypothetical protein